MARLLAYLFNEVNARGASSLHRRPPHFESKDPDRFSAPAICHELLHSIDFAVHDAALDNRNAVKQSSPLPAKMLKSSAVAILTIGQNSRISSMKRLLGAVAVASAIALPMTYSSPTMAQIPADLLNPQVEFEYVVPTNPDLIPVYERLKTRKALEIFQQFLAPLKLKSGQKLLLKLDQCGDTFARYKRLGPATVCYELVQEIERLAPTARVQLVQTEGRPPVRADSALIGPFVQEMLHEVAISVFDLLEIPVWGRKDDAADRVAALIMLRFSKFNMAWTTIVGTAWFLAGSALGTPDFSDVRGIMAQRYYTMLCIAVGADQKTFGGFVAQLRPKNEPAAGDLPAARARGCGEEYATLLQGIQGTISQYLDPALVQRVQTVKWLE
jgi:hypothetical protein